MRTLILYKSKHGATEKYARWLHEEIERSSVFDMDNFDPKYLPLFVDVIIGTCIYTGKLYALDFITKNWEVLKDKNLYVFSVGLINPNDESSLKTYYSIPENIRSHIQYIKIPGQLKYKELSWYEKIIVSIAGAQKTTLKPLKKYLKPVLDDYHNNHHF